MIGIAVAIGAVVCLWSGERSGEAAEAQAAHATAASDVAPQFADDERRDVHPSETREVAAKEPEQKSAQRIDIAPWEPPKFEYELHVRVIDEADQPGLKEPILLAPAGHTLNHVGAADLDGRLVVKWLGFEPAMQVDVSLNGGESLRRVDLTAGVSQVALAKRGGMPQVAASPKLDSRRIELARTDLGELKRRDLADAPPQAKFDDQGRVRFVEPLLYAGGDSAVSLATRKREIFGALALSHDKGAIRFSKTEWTQDPLVGEISGRLLDAAGAPVAGAPVLASFVGGGPRPSTVTQTDGSYRLRNLQPGDWDVRAGGGPFGRASSRISVLAGPPTDWTATLDRGVELEGRLIDSGAAPLARWKVQVEVLGGDAPLVDVATTDADGRFAIPNLPTLPLRLIARSEHATPGSDVLVAEQVWPGKGLKELVVDARADLAPGALFVQVAGADGAPVVATRATLWREGTARGLRGQVLRPEDLPTLESELGRLDKVLRFSGLETGWYTLEIDSPAREQVRVSRTFIAAQNEARLGPLLAPEPALLSLGSAGEKSGLPIRIELVFRGPSVELCCDPTDALLIVGFVRPGDYRIVRTLGEQRLERWLHLEAGTATELE